MSHTPATQQHVDTVLKLERDGMPIETALRTVTQLATSDWAFIGDSAQGGSSFSPCASRSDRGGPEQAPSVALSSWTAGCGLEPAASP